MLYPLEIIEMTGKNGAIISMDIKKYLALGKFPEFNITNALI